ncbi:MAG: aminomethyl transferase family protein [Chloroflexi bacterium]|nr:MAG: aminomethyl transferase family protein [Chloroflexota bacterium]
MNKVKLSPIHEIAIQKQAHFVNQQGWQVVDSYGDITAETAVITTHTALCDQSHNGKIRIEGKMAGTMLNADELVINAGKPFSVGWVYRLRRDLFFVSVAAEDVEETAVSLTQQANNNPGLITVTDITQGNAELWLVGPKSAELLSRLCGLDFDNNAFPNGVAKQSSVAKTNQIIVRRDLDDVPVYALIGGRSLAAYLWQTILDAGQDLGIQPIGQEAIRKLTIDD